MLDIPGNPLSLLREIWQRLPRKLVVLVAVGLFVLGTIGCMLFVRRQINQEPATAVARHLVISIDVALIVLISLVVIVAIAAVVYALIYRET